MNKNIPVICAALIFAGSAPAWAQTSATGRLTYLDSAKDRLMLNNDALYAMEPGLALRGIGVGDDVRLNENARHVVDRITKTDLPSAGT